MKQIGVSFFNSEARPLHTDAKSELCPPARALKFRNFGGQICRSVPTLVVKEERSNIGQTLSTPPSRLS